MEPSGRSVPRRAALIVNVAAGRVFVGSRGPDHARLAGILRDAGVETEVLFLKGGKRRGRKMDDVIREALANRPEAVFVAGGDGTMNAAAAALAALGEAAPPLGPIPGGSFNYLARMLELPMDHAQALRAMLAAWPSGVRRVDLLDVNGRLATSYFSVGVFASFIRDRIFFQKKRGFSKAWAIVRALFSALVRWPVHRLRVRVGAEPYLFKSPFLFVANDCRVLNPMRLGGDLDALTDGLACALVSVSPSRLALIKLFLHSWLGRLVPGQDFLLRDAAVVRANIGANVGAGAKSRKVRASLDGEAVRLKTPIVCAVRRGALKVLTARPAPDESEPARNAAAA